MYFELPSSALGDKDLTVKHVKQAFTMEQTCNYYKNTGSLKAAFHVEMNQTSYIFQTKEF